MVKHQERKEWLTWLIVKENPKGVQVHALNARHQFTLALVTQQDLRASFKLFLSYRLKQGQIQSCQTISQGENGIKKKVNYHMRPLISSLFPLTRPSFILSDRCEISGWKNWPVTGASMSSKFFSERRMAAPSPMRRRATLSSTRPSLVRWAFRTSTLGFPSLSNTSFTVSLWLGGNGTAGGKTKTRYYSLRASMRAKTSIIPTKGHFIAIK